VELSGKAFNKMAKLWQPFEMDFNNIDFFIFALTHTDDTLLLYLSSGARKIITITFRNPSCTLWLYPFGLYTAEDGKRC